jgi:catechol 2,3-dioxygenase-like lactoylglutathione lyase family enzyme
MSGRDSGIRGLDHVAVPMQNTDAMLSFYRGLGLEITETPRACSVHIGSQMINFHRPETWQDPNYTLRAPGTTPPSGDFCVVWEGTEADLRALLERVGAPIEEGPVERRGARKIVASSIYTRDPDGNLLEFMRYQVAR